MWKTLVKTMRSGLQSAYWITCIVEIETFFISFFVWSSLIKQKDVSPYDDGLAYGEIQRQKSTQVMNMIVLIVSDLTNVCISVAVESTSRHMCASVNMNMGNFVKVGRIDANSNNIVQYIKRTPQQQRTPVEATRSPSTSTSNNKPLIAITTT